MTYLSISEEDLELVITALRLLSLQRLFGENTVRAERMAAELEIWKARQDQEETAHADPS